MFDAILVTLREAAVLPGRSTLVVFSNGRDTLSMLAPDDVAQVAENAGIPIYVVSTQMEDLRRQEMLDRVTTITGGREYEASNLAQQQRAFRSIGDDRANSYVLTYTPPAHSSGSFHRIEVRLPATPGAEIRARSGYTASPDTE